MVMVDPNGSGAPGETSQPVPALGDSPTHDLTPPDQVVAATTEPEPESTLDSVVGAVADVVTAVAPVIELAADAEAPVIAPVVDEVLSEVAPQQDPNAAIRNAFKTATHNWITECMSNSVASNSPEVFEHVRRMLPRLLDLTLQEL